MPIRSSKKKDFTENAFSIVQKVTGQAEAAPVEKSVKNPAAVALGRLGGLKGGRARAEKLSKKKLSEIGKKAAQQRWAKPA
jgi:hypothetical protein